jgi:hypothetical protein
VRRAWRDRRSSSLRTSSRPRTVTPAYVLVGVVPKDRGRLARHRAPVLLRRRGPSPGRRDDRRLSEPEAHRRGRAFGRRPVRQPVQAATPNNSVTRYVVANPSSYLYFGAKRFSGKTLRSLASLSRPHAAGTTITSMAEQPQMRTRAECRSRRCVTVSPAGGRHFGSGRRIRRAAATST